MKRFDHAEHTQTLVTLSLSSMLIAAVLEQRYAWWLGAVVRSNGLETTGSATALAALLIKQTQHHPDLAIGLIYLATMLLTKAID